MNSDMTSPPVDWHKELELLILRHEEQGAGYDLASMTESDKRGLYMYLKNLEG